MKLKDFKNLRKTIGLSEKEKQEIQKTRDSKITYQELFRAAEIFEDDPDASCGDWGRTRKFVDWKNFSSLPTEEVRRRIIGFLNRWHCRLPASDELAERIQDTYREMTPFIDALKDETLEDLNFENKKIVDGAEYSTGEILTKVFENFSGIGYNFRGVAASKLLSLINPCLFVMWDISISKAYGIRSPSEPYARDRQYTTDFLPLMIRKANSVLDSYMKDKKCNREEAVKGINSFRKGRHLAKLLDEYNWTRFYQGL